MKNLHKLLLDLYYANKKNFPPLTKQEKKILTNDRNNNENFNKRRLRCRAKRGNNVSYSMNFEES